MSQLDVCVIKAALVVLMPPGLAQISMWGSVHVLSSSKLPVRSHGLHLSLELSLLLSWLAVDLEVCSHLFHIKDLAGICAKNRLQY